MNYLDEANEKLKSTLDAIDRDRADQINKLEKKEKQLLDRLERLKDEKHKIAAAHGSIDVSDDDLIEINAGGKIIAAKRGVLTQIRDSRLAALFSGRWDKKLTRDKYGRIFLDVNGKCFRSIVDYLNEMAISSEDEQPEPPSIDDELGNILEHQMKIFGLPVVPPIDNCTIVSRISDVEKVRNWLKEAVECDVRLELLYRSSRDGLSASNFHSKCDNKGPTVVILETTDGGRIGGFTNTSWSSNDQYAYDDKAFLFALSGFGLSSPCKMKLLSSRNPFAICNISSYGPTFGFGHDLLVDGLSLALKIGNTYDNSLQCDLLTGNSSFFIKEMEVFQVSKNAYPSQYSMAVETVELIDTFSKKFHDAINNKWTALGKLEADVLLQEESFEAEKQVIESFANGDANDSITLNVSGTIMATSRETLLLCKDSVLAQQFDNSKWTEQGCTNLSRVKDWTPDDVTNWVKSLKEIPDDIAILFSENGIKGFELLALNSEGLKMIGVKRAGTICFLMKEIKKLEEASQDSPTLIEYSPYCFGKILDFLRLKRQHSVGLTDEPSQPLVCESQQKRFEKILKYYFPGDCSNFILGTGARKRQRVQ